MILLLWKLLVIKFCSALGADINHHRLSNETESDYNFPVPQIENVYQAWKPIDYGHPLVDPTLHYVPPPLEVVQIGPSNQDKDDYYYDEEEYDSNGISDNNLNALIYSSVSAKEMREELHIERAKQQSKVVRAKPSSYIPDPNASPRLDLGEIRRQPLSQDYTPLKSGMYYVDDPHERFREKHKRPHDKRHRYGSHLQESDRRQHWVKEGPENSEAYFPVSLMSTPPTITTTRRPYGEIVNKDFFDKLRSPSSQTYKAKNPRIVGPRDVVAKLPNRGGEEHNLFPLGAPHSQLPQRRIEHNKDAELARYRPRLEGVLGPPRPSLDSPGFVDRRSSIIAQSWEPQNVSYYIEDREVVYPRNTMVYNTDTKSQVSQFSYGPEKVVNSVEQKQMFSPGGSIPQNQQHIFHTEAAANPSSILEKAGMVMKHIAGVTGFPGPEQHKFQLIYSREPAEVDKQPLHLVDSLSQRCLHGLPSFLKHLCVERQRTDRSSFSERSDENIEDLMFIDTSELNGTNLKELAALSQNIPEYRSLQSDSEANDDENETNGYQLVQDTQYGSQGKQEDGGESKPATEVPFAYVENRSNADQSKEIIYSVAGGNVAVYKPDETTKPPVTTLRTTSTTTITTTTSTDTPAIPYQYQPPLPGLTPQAPLIRKRPLVYNKRQKTGSAVSRPFEYISKLKDIINERIFRPRPVPRTSQDKPFVAEGQEKKPAGPGRRSQLITRRVPGRKFFFF